MMEGKLVGGGGGGGGISLYHEKNTLMRKISDYEDTRT